MNNQNRPESGYTNYDIGMVGLGVMGRNFLLNIADHGFASAGFDRNAHKVVALNEEGKGKKVKGVHSLPELIEILRKPRIVIMLVQAGKAVDAVINDLIIHLDPGDIIIDGGNSHYTDTNRHFQELSPKGIHFLGVGISGGEKGARFGPSIMPGGPKDAYKEVRQIFEKVSAKVNDEPCVAYLGPGSAGHYVKMVHNGIEYALIQLISETYHLMKKGMRFNNDKLHKVYKKWNEGELQSFLVEITANIFLQPDDESKNRLIDMILDAAKQKGTGKWTTQDAMDLQLPVPTIDSAVEMRDMSAFKKERENASGILAGPIPGLKGKKKSSALSEKKFVEQLHNALYFGMIVSYAQGMTLLRLASEQFKYNLNLQEVAKIWRGGCIIRSGFLENIRSAYNKNPDLLNLMIEPGTTKLLGKLQNDLRAVVTKGIKWGIPVPAFSSSLSYYDSYRSRWLPANLIQAQRDFFGSHTYERIDREGVFHTNWNDSSGGN